MDPNGFLNALGHFPGSMAGDLVEALPSVWNGEVMQGLRHHRS